MGGGGTVTLLSDTTTDQTMLLMMSAAVVLDLSGFTLNVEITVTTAQAAVLALAGSLTIANPQDGSFNVTINGSAAGTMAVEAINANSVVQVTNTTCTGDGCVAALARNGGVVTIYNGVTASGSASVGVQADGAGAITNVTGDVSSADSTGIGAAALNGGLVVIDGTLSSGGDYVTVQGSPEAQSSPDGTATRSGNNYNSYSDGNSTVLVKAVPLGITCPADLSLEQTDYVTADFTATGDVPFTDVTVDPPDITWEGAGTSTLDIYGSQLALGDTDVTVTVTNGVDPDASCQFTVTVGANNYPGDVTVWFVSNGHTMGMGDFPVGTKIQPMSVSKLAAMYVPGSDYSFLGWSTVNPAKNGKYVAFNFNKPVPSSLAGTEMYLYAWWIKVDTGGSVVSSAPLGLAGVFVLLAIGTGVIGWRRKVAA